MATVKSKKPVSKKLKAGKKKRVNKWLIVGGIVAVAIIGTVIVRFSSASQWVSMWRSTERMEVDAGYNFSTSVFRPYTNGVKLAKGGTYRYCIRGNFDTGSSSLRIALDLRDLNNKPIGKRAVSTKTYGSGVPGLHCSAEFRAVKSSYIATGHATVLSSLKSSATTFKIHSQSIDYLR